MKCNKCGAEHPSYAKFCAKCGAPLAVAPIAVPPAEKASEAPVKETSSNSPTLKEIFSNAKYAGARTKVFYVIAGVSTFVMMVIGLSVGWSAWMFLPLVFLIVSLVGFFREISQIGISNEELDNWNKQRENNKIFKKPITDTNRFSTKIQYWHASFKPNKMIAIVATGAILFMYLPLIVGSSVRFAVKNTNPDTTHSGGGSTKRERQFRGFWPEADYIVKLPEWEGKVLQIWDPTGNDTYNRPLGSSVNFAVEVQCEQGDFARVCSLATTQGYTLTGISDDPTDPNTLTTYFYEREWGPSTTWHKNRYSCDLKIVDNGYNKDYDDYSLYMYYLYFDFGGE